MHRRSLVALHCVVAEGVHNIPHEGVSLLLPKHHAYSYMMVEGVLLYRRTKRYAIYLMRKSLRDILELRGGTNVFRPKDIRFIVDW